MLNNRLKKSFVVMLGLLLAVSLVLAGCSSNNNNDSKTSGNDAEAPAKQLKPITVTMYDRGNIPPEIGTAEKNLWTDWVNETVKVDYVPVPRWESVQKLNALLAAGDGPDLILDYDGAFRNQLYLQKQIMPIDDMIEQYSVDYKKLLDEFPLLRQLGTKADGKLYEFGRLLGYIPGAYLFIRQDQLDSLGMQVPATMEDAYEVMKAFVDKNPDAYGTNLSGYGWMDTAFQNTTWIIDNGEMVRDWDRVAAATSYKKRLFDGGLVDKDFLTDKNGEKALQDFLQGKTMMFGYMGNAVQVYNNYEILKQNNPNAKLAVIALPSSEFGQFSPFFNDPVQMTGVVNAKADDPQSIMKFVDLMSSEATAHTLKYGLEGVHYKLEDGKEVTLDQEKYEKEVSWLGDFRMLGAQHIINEFSKYMDDLDQSDPFDKEVYDMLNQAYQLYINKDRPLPEVTKYMPGLPEDIQFIVSNASEPISDLWSKAIVGGGKANVEKAVEDAKSLWSKSNGQKVEDFYANWYKENKDTWVFTKDIYDMNF
ncbi:extracellular solute-binding protein [Paenibacillus sp. HB172176]|uniref:extracellular solute-binding protein n=1 Tax=Paenibacillus sp. HB172176 TaxID=2493690 RepID=UPI00143A5DC5|nr:extracellular solute-binding protein [Paenibacillus sp. HB172176]